MRDGTLCSEITRTVAVFSLFLAFCAVARADATSAQAVEARLVAPCCWVQTLDVHESELASALRTEIEQRVAAGESSAAIEADFASRFGERVRAVPLGAADPTDVAPIVLIAYLVLTAVGLGLVVRARRKTAIVAETPVAALEKDELDQRIDDQLARLDDA